MSAAHFPAPQHPIQRDAPAWDIALLFPHQGHWSEEEYLALNTNQLVELVDGCVEVLPMPTVFHQLIVKFLHRMLDDFVTPLALGLALFAPLPVRLWPAHLREPDVLFLRSGRVRDKKKPPDGADLVMEVVSEGEKNRERDLEIKRREYAKAKIPEYWIIDPERQTITVLKLVGEAYQVHGEFSPGQQATSVLLPGFALDVAAVFAAGQ